MVVKSAISAGIKQLTKGLSKKAAAETVELFGRQTMNDIGELVMRNPEQLGYVTEAISKRDFKALNDITQEAATSNYNNRFATQKQNFTTGNYTRPDAIENLQAAGSERLTGRKTTPRTIQGPGPPRLSDPTFSQGATSYEEAVMGATTKFVEDGVPKQIRNYGSDTAPHGRVTSVGARKTSGRGITAEGNTRKINEALATAPDITPEETAAFGKAMAEAAAEGMDGDHIIEVSRVANAVRHMSPARRKAYFKILKNTGTYTGNHPKNIQKLTKELNQVVKPAQIRALDKALRAMDKRSKTLLEEMLGI